MKKHIKRVNINAPLEQNACAPTASTSGYTIAYPTFRKKIYYAKKPHNAIGINERTITSEPATTTVNELQDITKDDKTTISAHNSTLNKSVDNNLITDRSTSANKPNVLDASLIEQFARATKQIKRLNSTMVPLHNSTLNKSVDTFIMDASPINLKNSDFSSNHPKLSLNCNKQNLNLNIDTKISINISCAEPKPIRINVGGIIYISSYETLNAYPNTRFATLFNKDIPIVEENLLKQHFFIDRDGKMFRHILNFLRNKQLLIPDEFKEIDLLYAEAKYFLIKPMVYQIGEYKLLQSRSVIV